MKKLFSVLLALAMLTAMALPVVAEFAQIDFQVSPNVTVPAIGAETYRDEIYDEKTMEFIGYGPEWTYYPWYSYCYVDMTRGGQTESIRLESLPFIVDNGMGKIGGGIIDSQSAETPWQVGNTYDAVYYLFNHETGETVWSVDLKVTLTEPSPKIELSKITMDELATSTSWMENEPYKYYAWSEKGRVDVTIDGTQHKNITMASLQQLLSEEYGSVSYGWRNTDESFEQSTNPWKAGDVHTAYLQINGEKQYLFDGQVTIEIQETKVASVSAKPMTYYAYQGGAEVEFVVTYKDNTTGPCEDLEWTFSGDYPTEPGTYTLNFKVANTFDVPVQVTVLPNPTSGKLGENVEWKYDAATETMTVFGVGDTYYTDVDIENASDEFRDWNNAWVELNSALKAKHIVVKDGVTGLAPGIFLYCFAAEDITLPNSMKKMPLVLIGPNGPSSELDLGLDITTKGVTSFVLPKNITEWKEFAFYDCWGLKEIYLPAGLTTVNIDNLIYTAFIRQEMELPAQETKIHFAGTKAQWDAITFLPCEGSREDSAFVSGLSLNEAKAILDTFTITYEDPAPSYQEEEIVVDKGVASVPDSVVEIQTGKDTVIDVTVTTEKADTVELKAETVDKLVSVQTSVEVKLPEMTVTFDKAAVSAINTQSGDNAVKLVAKKEEKTALNAPQKEMLEKTAVHQVLTLETYAGQTKISDFGGGKVTVSVPFVVPAGKKAEDFVVAYVANNGKVTEMPTTCTDGFISFDTYHFSTYVVAEKATLPDSNPKTGEMTVLALPAALLIVGFAGVVVCEKKRRAI